MSPRYTLTIAPATDTKTFSAMDYGVDGWLDWDVETKEQAILRELEELRSQVAKKTKTKKEKKPKAVPKYVSEAGANAKAQRRLQNAGKLEPFREGGCRCRTFGNGLGNQCHAKATIDGFCKTHHKKVVLNGNGLWTMGFYDELRPEIWGEEKDGLCHPVPGDRKEGNTIPWKMDAENFTKAFAELNRLDQAGRVELDLVEAEGSDNSAPATPEQSDEEVAETCDFCENERSILTKRDAGYDEWTCEKCHKEQYPEQYEGEEERLLAEVEGGMCPGDEPQTPESVRSDESDTQPFSDDDEASDLSDNADFGY